MGGLLAAAAPIVNKLLAFIPDPQQKAQAQLALFHAQQAGEFKEIDAQIALAGQQTDVDKAEAQSSDPLQHWRGGLGWVCTLAFAEAFLLIPTIGVILAILGKKVALPQLELGPLITLTAGMLGLGGLHVAERIKGAA